MHISLVISCRPYQVSHEVSIPKVYHDRYPDYGIVICKLDVVLHRSRSSAVTNISECFVGLYRKPYMAKHSRGKTFAVLHPQQMFYDE